MGKLSISQLADIARTTLPKGGSVWLYGSRARGEERADSDWDLLVLIDKPQAEHNDFDRYCYPMIEYGWRYGADLSPQLYTKAEWTAMQHTPYAQNVEHDKKVIYES